MRTRIPAKAHSVTREPITDALIPRLLLALCLCGWAGGTELTWNLTNPLAQAEEGHSATLLASGAVLVVGRPGAEVFDSASGTWATTGSPSQSRTFHTATLLPSGEVLVAGGLSGGAGSSACELYDPTTGTWSDTGSLHEGRYYHTATLLQNGKVLVAGGAWVSSCELYDPASGTWSSVGALSTIRALHTGVLLPSGRVLVAGGYDGGFSPQSSCEMYDPATSTWSPTGALGSARFQHTATSLPTGKVLVSGGCGSGYLASCEIFDPGTGTWQATGSMAEARFRHTANLFGSQQILVIGGSSAGSNPGVRSTCEIYDANAGTWSNAGSLVMARQWHTTTILPSGQVLVTGGSTFAGAISSCELDSIGATPQTLQFSSLGSLLYGVTPAPLAATASSGLLPVFAVISGPATVQGNALQLTGTGTIEIAAYQAGNAAYAAAPVVTQSATILPGPQTISFLPPGDHVYGDAPLSLQATATSGLTPTFRVVSGPATISGTTLTITGAGTAVVAADQAGDELYAAAPEATQTFQVNPAPLAATAAPAQRTYGVANPAFTGAISGIVAGDRITATYASAATLTTPIGTYGPASPLAITPILADPDGRLGNYVPTLNNATLTIVAPTITGVAPGSGSNQGGTHVTLSGTNFSQTTAITFGGVPATSFSINSDTSVTCVTPAHTAGVVDIVLTTPLRTMTAPQSFAFQAPFTMVINTALTNACTSPSNAFVFPLLGTNQNHFSVDWGDATSTAYDRFPYNQVASHTYDHPGVYTVRITEDVPGSFQGFVLGPANLGDGIKLLNIAQWGDITWTTMASTFSGCENLVISATDGATARTGGVADFSSAWSGCASLASFPAIDTSGGTNFASTWAGCTGLTAFPALDMHRMLNGRNAFLGDTIDTASYNDLLIALASGNVNTGVTFNGGSSRYDTSAAAARNDILVGARGWTISDGGLAGVTGQTLTFPVIAQQIYGAAPLTLSATASSGLPVTFTVTSGPGSISGSTLTMTGAGTIMIAAHQAGDGTFAAAATVTRALVVEPAALTITANDAMRTFGVPNPHLTGTIMGIVTGDDITVSFVSAADETTPVGTYAPPSPQSIRADIADPFLRLANYVVSMSDGTLTIVSPGGSDPASATSASGGSGCGAGGMATILILSGALVGLRRQRTIATHP